MQTYVYTYIHTYIHTNIQTYIHTCIHAYIHACKHAYIHIYIVGILIFMCIYIYTHTHTHIGQDLPHRCLTNFMLMTATGTFISPDALVSLKASPMLMIGELISEEHVC